jgi:hypothetical protein
MTLKLILVYVREYLWRGKKIASLKADIVQESDRGRSFITFRFTASCLCLLVSLSVGIRWLEREADNSSVKLAIHLHQLQRPRVIKSLPSVPLHISTIQCLKARIYFKAKNYYSMTKKTRLWKYSYTCGIDM